MSGGKKRHGRQRGVRAGDWTAPEVAILHKGIREGWSRQQISAHLPDRSYGAMADKLLLEARKIGVAPPKRMSTARGRPITGTILKPDAPGVDTAAKDRAWAKMCAEGSARLLFALERFYVKRLSRLRFAAERNAKKARIVA